VPLNHYVMRANLGGSLYRPVIMRAIFGDVVFTSELNKHTDLDMGFRPPEHRAIPAGQRVTPQGASQPSKHWQVMPEWRAMPAFENPLDARRWVQRRLRLKYLMCICVRRR
jgi:hypothetical protein